MYTIFKFNVWHKHDGQVFYTWTVFNDDEIYSVNAINERVWSEQKYRITYVLYFYWVSL